MRSSNQTSGHEIDGPNWYAFYARHQHEKNLARSLGGKGFEVFLPLYTAVHRSKGRNKKLSLPLFPCYLFLRNRSERWPSILATPVLGQLTTTYNPKVFPKSKCIGRGLQRYF